MHTRKSLAATALLAVLTAGLPIWCQPARILINQVGYDPAGAKNAVVQGHTGDTFDTFTVREMATRKSVLTGRIQTIGPVPKWKDWVFGTIDFSPVTKEGSYVIEVTTGRGAVTSHPLTIQKKRP